MQKIKAEQVEKEISEIKKFLEDSRNIGEKERAYLRDRNYVLSELGTGKTVYICSKQIKILEPYHSYKNLPKKILAVGVSNIGRGKNVVYRAFTKEII